MMNVIGNYIGKQHGLTASAIASAYLATVEADGGVVEAVDCLTARIENLKTLGLWDKASAVWLPHGYKESKLYAVKGGANADLTLTRAGTRTRKGPTYVEQVPYNLLQYSNDFTNASWVKRNGATITTGQPFYDGSLTASKLIEGSGAFTDTGLRQNPVLGKTGIKRITLYAKAAERSWIKIQDSNVNSAANFNLSNGTVGTLGPNVTGASITPVGEGWYFISFNGIVDGTPFDIYIAESDNVIAYTGNGTSGLYISRAQMIWRDDTEEYFNTTTRFNIPALDYTNDTCPALSLEPARTNLFLQSEDLSHADWIKGASPTITVNDIAAPDGLSTADKIAATAASGVIIQTRSLTVGATHTTSFYVKKGTHNYVYIRYTSGTAENFVSQVFDLSDGSLGELKVGTSSGTLVSATTQQVLDDTEVFTGWYRVILIASHNIASGNVGIGFAGAKTGNIWNTSGTVTSGVFTGAETIYVWGAQLEAGSYATSYIPTTTATVSRIADAINVLQPEKTNLLLQSQTFDNSNWTKGSSTVTPNTIIAPDGTTTADTMFETVASSTHYVLQAVDVVAGNQYSLSVCFKYNGRQWATISCSNTANTNAWFDILNGVTGTAQSNVISSSIIDLGDGWYRCQISFIATTSGSSGNVIFASRTADSLEAVFIGDVTKGLYLWGAQLEKGSVVTTYLPTTTVPIHDGSVIGQTEGTLYFEGGTYGTGDAAHENFFSISDGTSNNRIEVLFRSTDVFQCVVTSGGVLVADITGGTVVSGQSNKIVVTYGPDGVKLVANGVKIGEDLVVVIPATSVLRTANRYDGGTPFYGFETGRAISTTAMTEAQAIALTTP